LYSAPTAAADSKSEEKFVAAAAASAAAPAADEKSDAKAPARGAIGFSMPTVHCYCFSNAEDPSADALERARKALGSSLPGATVHTVRTVSTYKDMLCVSFRLPEAVALVSPSAEAAAVGSPVAAADVALRTLTGKRKADSAVAVADHEESKLSLADTKKRRV